ncbi:competence protein ComEC family protein [Patescibacteria group bacterium]|nr:competence protein ComEC family protein [Patescibacteria group bacterium]MBU4353530.1 competence protein ComEC family protein [Patescibacteria group bacterium]MBU4477445.1 competence protein ComEC family protein [Patescibacteria group bacterium]MCG2699393.1 competence protein ComEC family protein [Candidatus Parcubacteria bacterium]
MCYDLVILGGFAVGVLIRSFIDFGLAFAGLFIFIGVVFLLLRLFKFSQLFLVIGLVFCCAGFGMFRYEIKDAKGNFAEIEKNLGSKTIVQGIICDEPDERENYTRLVVDFGGTKILITAKSFPKFNYGDEVKFAGILKRAEDFNNIDGNGNNFSWRDYLAKDDIYFEMIYPEIELVAVNQKSRVARNLFRVKQNFLSAISKVVPEPNSAFLGGVTVGAKQSMPKNLQEDFKKTGIIHVVVLSGYNITIVAAYIMRLFSFLPQILGISLGIFSIILFAIMVGASATVVRASIMAVFILAARATGRIYIVTRALFLAGFFMLLHNPKILRFDASFQLSFLATLGLIYLAPYFEKKLNFLPAKFKIREFGAATLSAQILVLPLLLYKTGVLSLVALPVNLLVLILIPATMFFGFLAGLSRMLAGFLAAPFGWVSYFLTQYELGVVGFFAEFPFASMTISQFPLWLMLFMYCVYGIIFYKIYKIDAKR